MFQVRTATDWFEAAHLKFPVLLFSILHQPFLRKVVLLKGFLLQAQCPATDETDLDVEAQIARLEEEQWERKNGR